jgi:hypothetical protein
MTDVGKEIWPPGRRIRDRRLEMGYRSIAEAAVAADIGADTWGVMERNRLPKTDKVRQKVAKALKWPKDALDVLEAGSRPADDPTGTDPNLLRQLAELREEVRGLSRGQDALETRLDEMQQTIDSALRDRAAG